MKSGAHIPLRNSIATRILLVVLGLYLLIASTAALGQLWMNYRYQKTSIAQELVDFEGAFGDELAISLWNLDEEELRVAVKGMLTTPTITGVKGQIQQVLMNLCVNARDAMQDGGSLTFKTEDVLIEAGELDAHFKARPGRYSLLSVIDSGCGMDEETCEKIFDPFFTTKEVGKGTGLGLSTVYGIVKQNEGDIDVSSELGKGTTFNVYLPVSISVLKEASLLVSQDGIASEGGIETILVVEDDETILELTNHTLSDKGYTVLTARDGDEAVRIFKEHADEIDCVIMDVVMPRMGGKEAMEKILKMRPSLRHLFVSGYSPNAGHTNFIKEERLHLLNKPYQSDGLLRKIREVLDEDRQM